MKEIEKIKTLYLEQFPEDGLTECEIKEIEDTLGVVLPNDFKDISQFFSGGTVGIVNFYDFKRSNSQNVIDETIRLREIVNLPETIVVLSEEGESIVLLDLNNTPAIIWCDSVEIEKDRKSVV